MAHLSPIYHCEMRKYDKVRMSLTDPFRGRNCIPSKVPVKTWLRQNNPTLPFLTTTGANYFKRITSQCYYVWAAYFRINMKSFQFSNDVVSGEVKRPEDNFLNTHKFNFGVNKLAWLATLDDLGLFFMCLVSCLIDCLFGVLLGVGAY